MATAYLSLRNLVKSYDGVGKAVDDVSLEIARGEFVTFLGPSGSGKTTTLMMIAGFEQPTSGVIELDGRDLSSSRPHERNIGMVFQSYALFPHMSALDNVRFPLRMRGVAAAERTSRALKMLELVGLSDFAGRYPRELSGGQQQRVALARALVFNPDLLLLDEPLGALDKNLREQMQVEIKRIHTELRITMIYVTHDQTEAMTMSDRVAVFRAGCIEQIAPPLEIYRRPASRFVGEFVGDSNFFPGVTDPASPGRIDLGPLGIVVGDGMPAAFSAVRRDVDVMLRPERLRLVREGASAPANRLSMQVEAIINYGDSVLAIGKAAGMPVRVRIPGAEPGVVAPGTTIEVGWAPGDAHVLAR